MKSASLLCFALTSAVLFSIAVPWNSANAQILETETARIPQRGHFEIGSGYEFQKSLAGTEHATPFAIEMGLTNRLALLVEPVPYTSIRPKKGTRSTGVGDIEVTATYVAIPEAHGRPALAFAGEVKIPTARDKNIGTTRPDYAGYLIMSKRSGRFDSHVNAGYTIVGQPAGIKLSNIINGAIATEFHMTSSSLIFGEVLATTAATADGESGSNPGSVITPEASAGELVGTLGVGHFVARGMLLSLGISYDNSRATLFRPGVTISF